MKFKKLIGLVMAGMMLVMAPAQSLAASDAKGSGGKYVSDVYAAYADNGDSAKKILEEKGYTPVKGDLNEGGKTYVMMGYKTTDNKDDAIRDLAVMNSNGGYSVGDYENVLRERKTQIAGFLKDFMAVVKEYRNGYKNGSFRAKVVHDVLLSYIEDDSKKNMGDLLLGDTVQDKMGIEESVNSDNKTDLPDLVDIVMQGNSRVIKNVYALVAMAADSGKTNFVDRFAAKSYDDMVEEVRKEHNDLSDAKAKNYLSGKYQDTAKALQRESAQITKGLKKYEDGKFDITKDDPKDVEKELGDTKDAKTEKKVEAQQKEIELVNTAALYENLKNYEGGIFKKGDLLKFFKKDTNKVEDFYPMAAALTRGQLAALTVNPLGSVLNNSFMDEAKLKEELKQYKVSTGGLENVSVYSGVDRDVFKTDGSVAMTDEAKRNEVAALPVDRTEKSFWNVYTIGATAGWAASAAFGIGALVTRAQINPNDLYKYNNWIDRLSEKFLQANKKGAVISDEADLLKKNLWDVDKIQEEYVTRFAEFTQAEKELGSAKKVVQRLYGDTDGSIFKNPAGNWKDLSADDKIKFQFAKSAEKRDFYRNLSNGFKYVAIAIALISAGVTIAALLTTEEGQLPPVPKYIVDVGSNKEGEKYAINYKAGNSNGMDYISKERKNRGELADLKAYQGDQWLTMYAAKDELAGKPITTDFVVQKDKTIPSGYNGTLHKIGEKGSVNIVSVDYMNYSRAKKLLKKKDAEYLFYKHSTESETASAFSHGMLAMCIGGGLIILVLIALVMRRSRKNSAA